MKGAVAAGHPLTAEAGARILTEGGNAVDACVAAAFVSWVAESPLTGPGAGGFMLVHRARDRSDRILDFGVAAPGRGLPAEAGGEMDAVEVTFAAEAAQVFLIGAASCAVPGVIPGLAAAHASFGRLPWRELVLPAVEAARAGVRLNDAQAFLHGILDGVLRHDAAGREVYGGDAPLAEGETVAMPELADTLERLGAEGPGLFTTGELGRATSAAVLEQGGRITEDDLAAYRVVRRRPVRIPFRDVEFVSNPPPSSGGILIAFALRVLDRIEARPPFGSADALALLAETMREGTRAREGAFFASLYRGGAARRLLADERVDQSVEVVRRRVAQAASERAGLPSTTHISVLDAKGNAAAHSASTGCGSGFFVPGTGIQLNNMLGEVDLYPGGRMVPPGARLTSMMAPSIVLADGAPRLVLGSAGSVRLRGAILQTVVNVLDHGMAVAGAIEAPRIHADGDVLQLEGGTPAASADELRAGGYEVARWPGRNLYFGGASAVASLPGGGLEAAGDPRRGGAGVVVA